MQVVRPGVFPKSILKLLGYGAPVLSVFRPISGHFPNLSEFQAQLFSCNSNKFLLTMQKPATPNNADICAPFS